VGIEATCGDKIYRSRSCARRVREKWKDEEDRVVIEVYFGTEKADRLKGKVVESVDGVLVLEYNRRKDYVNLDKVLAFWEV
jgi:Domain of unknown function (DUF6897)